MFKKVIKYLFLKSLIYIGLNKSNFTKFKKLRSLLLNILWFIYCVNFARTHSSHEFKFKFKFNNFNDEKFNTLSLF